MGAASTSVGHAPHCLSDCNKAGDKTLPYVDTPRTPHSKVSSARIGTSTGSTASIGSANAASVPSIEPKNVAVPQADVQFGNAASAAGSLAKDVAKDAIPMFTKMATNIARELCEQVDTELRLSQSQVPQSCSGSASLADLWGRFFRASDDSAFRNTALEVSPKSGGSSIRFTAVLERRPGRGRFGLECTVPVGDDGVLLVTGVERGGCVEAWNDLCAALNEPWKRVHLCAAILSVNGVSGDLRRMAQELSMRTHVMVVACNPPALHDAAATLRAVRAAAPPPIGEPFWANALRQYISSSAKEEPPAPGTEASGGFDAVACDDKDAEAPETSPSLPAVASSDTPGRCSPPQKECSPSECSPSPPAEGAAPEAGPAQDIEEDSGLVSPL